MLSPISMLMKFENCISICVCETQFTSILSLSKYDKYIQYTYSVWTKSVREYIIPPIKLHYIIQGSQGKQYFRLLRGNSAAGNPEDTATMVLYMIYYGVQYCIVKQKKQNQKIPSSLLYSYYFELNQTSHERMRFTDLSYTVFVLLQL